MTGQKTGNIKSLTSRHSRSEKIKIRDSGGKVDQ